MAGIVPVHEHGGSEAQVTHAHLGEKGFRVQGLGVRFRVWERHIALYCRIDGSCFQRIVHVLDEVSEQDVT